MTVECPDGQEHEPNTGCVYVADGTPPSGVGALMQPIPDGPIGDPPNGKQVHSFWIDERSVTPVDYAACVQAGQCSEPDAGEDCPWGKKGKEDTALSCVSWDQAKAYCNWAKKRLPTDAEWDRMANKPDEYGVTGLGGELAEWIGDYYCSEEIGGCGHARTLRGRQKPTERERSLPHHAFYWHAFRCAWSDSAPRPFEEPKPQRPLLSTTPGEILCNTTSCDLSSSACCHNTKDGIGRCVSKTKRSCRGPELWSECDEHTDCSGDLRCCPSWGCSGGCPEERVCQKGPCQEGEEICLPGGKCRAGFKCITAPGDRRGRCQWQDVGAWCGNKRCSGDKPVCCLESGKAIGTCTADQCKPMVPRFTCTNLRDCGGSTCGSNHVYGAPPEVNNPGFDCIQMSHMLHAVACDTLRDCPRHPPTGTKPKACRHTKSVPRGVKECIYFDGTD